MHNFSLFLVSFRTMCVIQEVLLLTCRSHCSALPAVHVHSPHATALFGLLLSGKRSRGSRVSQRCLIKLQKGIEHCSRSNGSQNSQIPETNRGGMFYIISNSEHLWNLWCCLSLDFITCWAKALNDSKVISEVRIANKTAPRKPNERP